MVKKTLAAVALSAVLSSAAVAGPFQINVGYSFAGGPSSLTGIIDELGYTGTLATSFYLGSPAIAGTTVIDTNIQSAMDSLGFVTGNQTTIGGNTVNFQYPLVPSQKNIDALNPINAFADLNGFTNGITLPYGFTGVGGPAWGLTYDYYIEGVTILNGVSYTSGYFDVFFEDGTPREQVLRLNVTGSTLNQANLDIFGSVSFDFDGNVPTTQPVTPSFRISSSMWKAARASTTCGWLVFPPNSQFSGPSIPT